MSREKFHQIRVDEDTEKKLDSMRSDMSYNKYLHRLIDLKKFMINTNYV